MSSGISISVSPIVPWPILIGTVLAVTVLTLLAYRRRLRGTSGTWRWVALSLRLLALLLWFVPHLLQQQATRVAGETSQLREMLLDLLSEQEAVTMRRPSGLKLASMTQPSWHIGSVWAKNQGESRSRETMYCRGSLASPNVRRARARWANVCGSTLSDCFWYIVATSKSACTDVFLALVSCSTAL